MTKNILEWGWHTSSPNTSSSNTEWKPATTLLGGADPDIKVAAWGDRRCQGRCSQGGSFGTTGMYKIKNRILCFDCAVEKAGVTDLPADEKIDILRPFLLQPE
jgi:hypothetical protein